MYMFIFSVAIYAHWNIKHELTKSEYDFYLIWSNDFIARRATDKNLHQSAHYKYKYKAVGAGRALEIIALGLFWQRVLPGRLPGLLPGGCSAHHKRSRNFRWARAYESPLWEGEAATGAGACRGQRPLLSMSIIIAAMSKTIADTCIRLFVMTFPLSTDPRALSPVPSRRPDQSYPLVRFDILSANQFRRKRFRGSPVNSLSAPSGIRSPKRAVAVEKRRIISIRVVWLLTP